MNIKSVLVLLAFGLSACSSGRYAGVLKGYHALIDRTIATAGDNAKELKKALKEVPRNEREGMAFLISYMPERDAKSLSADFLLENVQYAYKARAEFPWVKEVPDSVFLNDVVAYANLNENRESWRKDFYERFKKYVAGTPAWHDDRGNHNWNEVWIDGQWRFTEYYPSDDLDQSWFLTDAGKAIKEDVRKAIYAASFKPTGFYFPLVWDEDIRYVHAENVTDRYTSLYRAQLSAMPADGSHVALRVMVFKDKDHAEASGDRVATNLDVFKGEKQLYGGRSTGATQDMNDVLTFNVEKNQQYIIKYMNGKGEMQTQTVEVGDETTTLKLYMQ